MEIPFHKTPRLQEPLESFRRHFLLFLNNKKNVFSSISRSSVSTQGRVIQHYHHWPRFSIRRHLLSPPMSSFIKKKYYEWDFLEGDDLSRSTPLFHKTVQLPTAFYSLYPASPPWKPWTLPIFCICLLGPRVLGTLGKTRDMKKDHFHSVF